MGILKILTFPDPKLREVSKPVEKFDKKLKVLVEDMLATMYDSNGIGLAAPQIGVLERLLIVDTRPRDEGGRRYKYDEMTEREQSIEQPLIIANPVILKKTGKTTFDEGCLSVPTFFETVERALEIQLQYDDLKGEQHTIKVDGLLAICIQHEMDHLEGTLFIDHLSVIKSNRIKNQIKKHGYPEKEKKGRPDKKDKTHKSGSDKESI